MSDYVAWVLDVEIGEGKDEAFRALMREMVAATEANEPATTIYEWSVDAAGKVCSIYERYADSAGVLVHMTTFGKSYAERFLALCKPLRMVIFGSPDEQVRSALAALKPLYMTQIGGFARH